MKGFLLDTNIVSEARKGERSDSRVKAWFQNVRDDDLFLSVLVLGEIRKCVGLIHQRDKRQSAVLEKWVVGLESKFSDRVLPVTTAIANEWGKLTARLPVPVVDGLLAATAITHDLVLVTRN